MSAEEREEGKEGQREKEEEGEAMEEEWGRKKKKLRWI